MWQWIYRVAGRFARDRRGAVALLFGIVLVPMILGIGLAVDYSRGVRARQHLAQALDAAALAVGSWAGLNNAQIVEKAQTYFDANSASTAIGTPGPLNVSINENTITLSATSTIPTLFMQLGGYSEMTVGALTEVTLNEKKIELVMVLDNTGSMGWSGKLDALKNAANVLVETLMIADQNAEVDEDVMIGLVPFAAAVNIGADKLNSGWVDTDAQSSIASEDFSPGVNVLDLYDAIQNRSWNGCVRARPAPHDTQDTPPTGGDTIWVPYFAPDEPDFSGYANRYASDAGYSGSYDNYDARQRYTGKYANLTIPTPSPGTPHFNCRTSPVTPLTPQRGTVEAAINEMVASGNTVIPAGLAWGWRLISPGVPFTEGAPYEDEDTIKAIVLLTDGRNDVGGGLPTHNRSQYSAYGFAQSGHLGATNGSEAEDVLDAKTTTLCTNIKAEGILLYTITFQVPSTSIQNLMRNCAGNPDMYYDSPSNEDLDSIFQDIAKGLADLRISK